MLFNICYHHFCEQVSHAKIKIFSISTIDQIANLLTYTLTETCLSSTILMCLDINFHSIKKVRKIHITMWPLPKMIRYIASDLPRLIGPIGLIRLIVTKHQGLLMQPALSYIRYHTIMHLVPQLVPYVVILLCMINWMFHICVTFLDMNDDSRFLPVKNYFK